MIVYPCGCFDFADTDKKHPNRGQFCNDYKSKKKKEIDTTDLETGEITKAERFVCERLNQESVW